MLRYRDADTGRVLYVLYVYRTRTIKQDKKMNLEQLQELIRSQRKERFNRNSQLSLGELIKEIEEAGLLNSNGEPKSICYDFGTAIPTDLDSYRGSYDELALGYKLTGYDSDVNHFSDITAQALLEKLKSAIGATYTGWKGGDFKMDKDTPVWVDNAGNYTSTAIVGILDDGWRLIIITAYTEF